MDNNTKIEVSKETAMWFEISDDLEKLWRKIGEAIENDCTNDKDIQKYLDEDFEPHLLGLSYSLEKWFGKSIFNRYTSINKDGVIRI